jgi:hypothetical protein
VGSVRLDVQTTIRQVHKQGQIGTIEGSLAIGAEKVVKGCPEESAFRYRLGFRNRLTQLQQAEQSNCCGMKYIQYYAKNHLPNALSNIHNIRDSVSPPSHLPPALSRESSTQFQRFTALTSTEMESETIDFRWFLCTKTLRVCSGAPFLLSPSVTILDQDAFLSRLCFIKKLIHQDTSSRHFLHQDSTPFSCSSR